MATKSIKTSATSKKKTAAPKKVVAAAPKKKTSAPKKKAAAPKKKTSAPKKKAAAPKKKKTSAPKSKKRTVAAPTIDVSAEQRTQRIAVAAYLRAEKRGFAWGEQQQERDWMLAEREVDEQLASAAR